VDARNLSYKKKWAELIGYYGARCFYCQVEIATTIDHVVPYSWDQDNEIENLVPACGLCNSLASNTMFGSVEEKRQFILNHRKKYLLRHAICTSCLLPFSYREHSPSLFLCAECYDLEYGTHNADTQSWEKWIVQLRAAGIPAEAHRETRRRLEGIEKNHKVKLETLIDEYSKVLAYDREFAPLMT